jgi:hypothetical protein
VLLKIAYRDLIIILAISKIKLNFSIIKCPFSIINLTGDNREYIYFE